MLPNFATNQVENESATRPVAPTLPPLVPGSLTAQVLARVWSGEEYVEVDWTFRDVESDQSGLITVVAHLVTRANLDVTMIAWAHNDVVPMYSRLKEQIEINLLYSNVAMLRRHVRTLGYVLVRPPDKFGEVRHAYENTEPTHVYVKCTAKTVTFMQGEQNIVRRPAPPTRRNVPLDVLMGGMASE